MSGKVLVASVGGINIDLAVRTPRVPKRGENLAAHDLVIGLGGKGGNSAVALDRMG
ncbi:MAG: ribokinase, partial [Chloroflexi bacterium]|nr:ribokinase [Chloroflexota bacterium]